jgi:hypothetical protein
VSHTAAAPLKRSDTRGSISRDRVAQGPPEPTTFGQPPSPILISSQESRHDSTRIAHSGHSQQVLRHKSRQGERKETVVTASENADADCWRPSEPTDRPEDDVGLRAPVLLALGGDVGVDVMEEVRLLNKRSESPARPPPSVPLPRPCAPTNRVRLRREQGSSR